MKSNLSNLKSFLANRIPPQLVIQMTNHCNAHCPQCGMRARSKLARSTLDRDTLKRILDAATERGVRAVSFTGGEPLLFLDDLVELMTHAASIGIPFVRTGTNGFLFRDSSNPDFEDRIKRLVERLVRTQVRNFWISIDSAYGEVHEQMRGLKGVVAGIEKAIPIFHDAGLFPSANLGINRRVAGPEEAGLHPERFGSEADYLEAFYKCYRQAFDRFYRFVHDLGFTIANTCYPMSISDEDQANGLSAVYAATSEEHVVRFTPLEKAMLYRALMEIIPRHRRHMRIFSPLSSLYMLHEQHAAQKDQSDQKYQTEAFGCRGGVDFFFINAQDGNTYPCGYRGNENLGKFWRIDLSSLKPNGDCLRCDWECFRDPSELCAPLLQSLRHPLRLSRQMYRDPVYRKLWVQDLRYYQACGFFDGREPMDGRAMKRFEQPD